MSSFRLDERERAKQFAGYFKELEDRLGALERSNQLNYASIEGGSLDIYDEEGTLRGSIGVQSDGAVALVPDPVSAEPPPTPTAPTVEAVLAGLVVGWDGLWADAETAPTDFALVQVHVGPAEDFTPSLATQIATIGAPGGGTATVQIEGYDPVWVRLVAQNTAALTSEASAAVQGTPRQAVSQDLINGIITDVKLAEEAVTAAKLAAAAVTTDKVAPNAITDLLLADDAVTAAKLAAGAVSTTALADGAVLTEKLAANAVTQAKLANGAVTELALADSAVTAAKVAAAAIDSAKLADLAVTAAKIGDAAVTTAKVATGAIDSTRLADGAVLNAKLAANAVTQAKLANGAVTELALADSAVTAAKVAAAAIDSTKLADLAVTAQKIGDQAVTTAKVATSAIDSTRLADGAVLNAKLAANAVTQTKIADGAVQSLAIADGAVLAAKVAANAIDSTKLADAAVTAAKIGAAAVTAGKLAAQSVTSTALTAALADTASQRWVDVMSDPSQWTVTQSGTGSSWSHVAAADASSGTTVGQAVGFIRIRGNTLIPYDPDVLYRFAMRVRATAQPAVADVVFFGALGIAADGVTLVNRDGSNSSNSATYFGASAKPVATSDGWLNIIGFAKGRALVGASGSTGPNNDPRSPGTVHSNVRYVVPYIWLNYNNQASAAGTMQVDAVSVEALKTGVVDSINLVAGSVTTAALATDSVTAGKIAADAITARELAANSVTAAELSAGSVTAAAIAANTITAGQLAANSVTAASIAAGSIQTAALATDAVAAGKIAADAITARELAANSVTAAEISAGAVTATAIFAGAVTATALATDAVTAGKVAADAITARELAANSVTAAEIAAGVITASHIAANTITAGQLAANSVTAASIAAGSIQTAALATDAVAAGKIAADAITARELAANSVTAAEISAGAVTATAIFAGAVTATALATDSVTAGKVAADAITARELAANSVTAAEIAAGVITASHIAANTITAGQLAANSVTAASIAAGSIQTAALATDAVAAGKIAADAITARELAANSVTAAEISAGSVTAAAVAAGAITAEKMTVVGGSNVLPDPSFEGPAGAAIAAKQTFLSIDTAFGNGSPASIKIDATSGTAAYRSAELTLLPITAGDQVYVAADYYPSTTWVGTEIDLQVRWEKADGTILSYSKFSTTSPVKGAWARLSGTATAPVDAMVGRVRVESGNATAGAVWWDNAVVRPVVPGVQIADGAITTPKMVANTINGDRIAAGTLDAAKITAGSITTSQLNVTTAASIVQKLYDAGADAARWKVGGASTTTATAAGNLTSVQVTDAQSGGYVMRAVGGIIGGWRPDVLIPFDPNVLYRISFTVRQTVAGSNTANQRVYGGVAGVAADGTTLVNVAGAAAVSSQHYVAVAAQNLTAGGGWQRYTGYLKGYAGAGVNGTQVASPTPTAPSVLHASARYISPLFYANYSAGDGTAEIGMFTIEVVETGAVQTVNIADGAITTPKMVAGSIQGDRITAGTLNADRIVGSSITTAQLGALSVTAAQLAANSVTATAIAAGSISATHIAAGAITADRLSATAIDGKTITGATVRTAASGARVTMDSSSLSAYGSGSQKIVLQPDFVYLSSPTPRLYFTSDDGTNLAYMQVVGAGSSDADLYTYSGAFTDGGDGQRYRYRTHMGNDSWVTERIFDPGTGLFGVSGVQRIVLNKVSASIFAPDIYAHGTFHADSQVTGRVSITPSAANTPTSTTVTGLGLSGTSPRAFATASSQVPGTQVTGVSCSDLSTSSVTIWLTRTNTTATSIDYMVIAGSG